jgi:NitT/TauT family transport system permease protein
MSKTSLTPLTIALWRAGLLASVLGFWLWINWVDPVVRDIFGSPISVFVQLVHWIVDGTIFYQLGLTALEAFLGFFVGSIMGIVVGFVFLFIPPLRKLFDPFIAIFAVMPRIVLAPIFMIWFGLGVISKAALVTLIVFFIVYFNVDAGLRNVQGALIDRTRLMGASVVGLVRAIYLPASLVWLLSSLKVAVGFAFLGAIVAEYLGATSGIGSLIAVAQSQNDPNAVMAGLLAVFITVVPLDRLLARIERRADAWRTS